MSKTCVAKKKRELHLHLLARELNKKMDSTTIRSIRYVRDLGGQIVVRMMNSVHQDIELRYQGSDVREFVKKALDLKKDEFVLEVKPVKTPHHPNGSVVEVKTETRLRGVGAAFEKALEGGGE